MMFKFQSQESERKANGTVKNSENNSKWTEAEAQFGKERHMELNFKSRKSNLLLDIQWVRVCSSKKWRYIWESPFI